MIGQQAPDGEETTRPYQPVPGSPQGTYFGLCQNGGKPKLVKLKIKSLTVES